jgi:hypothetical protein
MANETCMEWEGTRNRRGYGVLPSPVHGSRLAHRAALASRLGRPVQGEARHTCDNPPCVNPEHLLEGSHADNMRDAAERGRAAGPYSHVGTCKYGHDFSPENTWLKPNPITKSGFERVCITCRKRLNKEQAARRKAARHERGLVRRTKG